MKRMKLLLAPLALFATAALALASDAETSATATGGRGHAGSAAATARYDGNIGFARTNTRSGRVNLARGGAVGVDERGLSLSISTAIAPRRGPAIATNFNMSIDRSGRSSHSIGTAIAQGGTRRSATVAGSTTTRRGGSSLSLASGRTRGGGIVRARTESHHSRPRLRAIRRLIRRR